MKKKHILIIIIITLLLITTLSYFIIKSEKTNKNNIKFLNEEITLIEVYELKENKRECLDYIQDKNKLESDTKKTHEITNKKEIKELKEILNNGKYFEKFWFEDETKEYDTLLPCNPHYLLEIKTQKNTYKVYLYMTITKDSISISFEENKAKNHYSIQKSETTKLKELLKLN